MTTQEDWTRFVTLNPPNEVKFKMVDDLKSSVVTSETGSKAIGRITIINKSKSAVLFKVSILLITNYTVRLKQLTLRTIKSDPTQKSSPANIP